MTGIDADTQSVDAKSTSFRRYRLTVAHRFISGCRYPGDRAPLIPVSASCWRVEGPVHVEQRQVDRFKDFKFLLGRGQTS